MNIRRAADLQHKHSHRKVKGLRSWEPCQNGSGKRHASSEDQNTIQTSSDTAMDRVGLPGSLVIKSLGQAIGRFDDFCAKDVKHCIVTPSRGVTAGVTTPFVPITSNYVRSATRPCAGLRISQRLGVKRSMSVSALLPRLGQA